MLSIRGSRGRSKSSRSKDSSHRHKSHSHKHKHKKGADAPAGVCITCQGPATRQCAACFANICKNCSVKHDGERYCSQVCAEADAATHRVLEQAHAVDAAQELRMFIADPWDKQLYWRAFKWGSVLAFVALMWYGIVMLGESRPKRDIRDLAVQHGTSLDGTRVGETNLNRSKDMYDPNAIPLPEHLRPKPNAAPAPPPEGEEP